MLAIEMVSDQEQEAPDKEVTTEVFEGCRAQAIILSKSGPNQSVSRLVPPLCLSIEDVDHVAQGFDSAFKLAKG